jgi:hypothetical protein
MSYDRREFIRKTILTGTTLSLANLDLRAYAQEEDNKSESWALLLSASAARLTWKKC